MRSDPIKYLLPVGRRPCAVSLILCLALFTATQAAPATEDISTHFETYPYSLKGIVMVGPWRWVRTLQIHQLLSRATGDCYFLSSGPVYSGGNLSTRVSLVASGTTAPASATLVFARQSPTQYRYVKLTAGSPGTITLGQRGTIAGVPPWRRSVSAVIPLLRWRNVRVETPGNSGIRVYVNGVPVLSHNAVPLAAGSVGFFTSGTRARFDSFAFLSDANTQICNACHSGSPPAPSQAAPDVYRYWDGSWWDANRGGSSSVQQGGHGDRGGLAALECTGANGCHDLRLSPETHRDGIVGSRSNPSGNTFHLQAGFINSSPQEPWSVQETFDNYCYGKCHAGHGLKDHRHERDSLPAPGVVSFGTHGTVSDGESISFPVDSDLSTGASTIAPDFAPCISCHDPHGTGTTDADPMKNSNCMVRRNWLSGSDLCVGCHY